MKPNCAPILLVEDEPDLSATVQELLELSGFQVVTAANGREALAQLRDHGSCLVLLDLMMPVMDGWQFLDEVKKAGSPLVDTPIVVTSALADPAQLQGKQVRAVMKKPIGFAELVEIAQK